MRTPRPHPHPNKLELHQIQRLRCIGDSLWPVLLNGDEIEVCHAEESEIHPGDLVAFKNGRMKICHRVLQKRRRVGSTEYFIKGDNSARADGWIPYERLIGKVFDLPNRRSRILNKAYQRMALAQFQWVQPILPGPGRAQKALLEATAPWTWVPHLVRGRLSDDWVVPPPNKPGPRLRPVEDLYGHAYHYETLFPESFAHLRTVLNLSSPDKGPVLDLGGGEGRVTRSLVEQGYEVHYVDSSPRMVAAAAAKSAAYKKFKKIRWHWCDFRELDIKTQFQTILSVDSINCLESESAAADCLSQLRDRLLPTGSIWLRLPNLDRLSQMPEWLTNRWVFEQKIENRGKPVWLWRRVRQSVDGKIVWGHAVSSDRLTYRLLSSAYLTLEIDEWEQIAKSVGLVFTGNSRTDPCGSKTYFQFKRD